MIQEEAVRRFMDAATAQGLPGQVRDEAALALAAALVERVTSR